MGSEKIHWQTLQLRERVLGPEHPDTLTSMNNLALLLDSQEKYDETEPMYPLALGRQRLRGNDFNFRYPAWHLRRRVRISS